MANKAGRFVAASRKYLQELWSRREFAWYMAMGNLRSRNASTALGLVWWVLNPLLMGAVYYIVFGVILGISRDLSYLLSGVFVFYYTSTSITTGANSIIQNRTLLVNLQFPRLIMPITAVIEAGVGFLTSIPALYLIIGPTQGVWPPKRFLILFPIIFVIQSLFNLGMSALTARVTVPFRDVTNLIPHLLRIWFYLSPILYVATQFEKLPAFAATLFRLNPMVSLLGVYRSALLGYHFDPTELAFAAAWAVGIALIAITSFIKYEGKMARYL
jgi:teichoic acid transport system permease protein